MGRIALKRKKFLRSWRKNSTGKKEKFKILLIPEKKRKDAPIFGNIKGAAQR